MHKGHNRGAIMIAGQSRKLISFWHLLTRRKLVTPVDKCSAVFVCNVSTVVKCNVVFSKCCTIHLCICAVLWWGGVLWQGGSFVVVLFLYLYLYCICMYLYDCIWCWCASVGVVRWCAVGKRWSFGRDNHWLTPEANLSMIPGFIPLSQEYDQPMNSPKYCILKMLPSFLCH